MLNDTTIPHIKMEGKLIEIRHLNNGTVEHRHAGRFYWHEENRYHTEDSPVEFIGEVTNFKSHRVRC